MLLLISVCVVLLALIGAPLFAVFGAASIALFLNLPEGSWASVGIDVFSSKFAESTTLMTIPLFTFAGYLLSESGAPMRIVRLSRAWLGWLPGGTPLVCLFASAFFTTFTGGSGITIVAIGALLFPALLYEKYDEKFSLGLVTTGGSLGILFPPSTPLIFYGIIASLAGGSMSLNKLMVAGIVPGLMVVAVLAVYGAYKGIVNKVPRRKFNFKEARHSLWEAKWEVAIPFALVGAIILGLFRLHEASAFTALYVLIIEVFVYRDISIKKDLMRVTTRSMTMVGAILAIVACAVGFCGFNVQAQVPDKLADWMEQFIHSKYMFLFLLNIFLLIVGMLMDIFTAMMVVVPLLIPIAKLYGVDLYHLAIVFLLNLEIGYLTPPFGINLFISTIRFSRPFMYVVRSILVYIGILVFALAIVTYVPIFTTFLAGKVESEDLGVDAEPLSSESEEIKVDELADAGTPKKDEAKDKAGKEVEVVKSDAGAAAVEKKTAKPAERFPSGKTSRATGK